MNDLISRQAAVSRISDLLMLELKGQRLPMWDEVNEAINELPSAQRKGKWIATQEWDGRNYSCSCCRFSFMVDTCMYEPMWNFCPNCGAEMKGEDDGQDV